ncbi:MAG: hypothetical protein ACHP7B_03160 [Burkholderiales bacterium]
MRIRLASESFVETVVTLAAAALMTFAGFEMLEDVPAARDAGVVKPPAVVATPHVDPRRA